MLGLSHVLRKQKTGTLFLTSFQDIMKDFSELF